MLAMLVLALAGLFALVFGRINITSSLSLEGRAARYYGLALQGVVLVYGFADGLVTAVLGPVIPQTAIVGIVEVLVRFAIIVGAIVGLVPVFKPKPAGTITAVYKT